jgi:GNAT superfamily N-acetyltransferase
MPAERGAQFPVEIRHEYNSDDDMHVYTAHHKDDQIGYLHVSQGGGISDMAVAKEHQRKGVATAMFNHAVGMAGKNVNGVRVPHPEHSGHRTPSGDAWAKSTGPSHYFEAEETH